MSLPNEIDQDVACPDCGQTVTVDNDGMGWCNAEELGFSRKTLAALRNQRTPGTTEIPTSELERLRDLRNDTGRAWLCDTGAAIDAILARVPAKVDVVARLREMLEAKRRILDSRARDDAAALEAAIEAMEKKS